MIFFTKIIKEYGLYFIAFALGFILALRGCGDSEQPETIIVEKPVPTIEYVDRWKTDTVRFAQWTVKHDTVIVNDSIVSVRLDTVFEVDTLSIIETWLTELAKYDTTLNFKRGDIRIEWDNYQNRSEHLKVTLTPKPQKLGIILLAKVGTRSNFKDEYHGNVGAGLLFEKNRLIFGADYGYSGQHTINGVVGYKLR